MKAWEKAVKQVPSFVFILLFENGCYTNVKPYPCIISMGHADPSSFSQKRFKQQQQHVQQQQKQQQ